MFRGDVPPAAAALGGAPGSAREPSAAAADAHRGRHLRHPGPDAVPWDVVGKGRKHRGKAPFGNLRKDMVDSS